MPDHAPFSAARGEPAPAASIPDYSRLTPGARLLLRVLDSLGGAGAWCAWPTDEAIVENSGLTRFQVRRALSLLVALGIVLRYTRRDFWRWFELEGAPNRELERPKFRGKPTRILLFPCRLPEPKRSPEVYGSLGLGQPSETPSAPDAARRCTERRRVGALSAGAHSTESEGKKKEIVSGNVADAETRTNTTNELGPKEFGPDPGMPAPTPKLDASPREFGPPVMESPARPGPANGTDAPDQGPAGTDWARIAENPRHPLRGFARRLLAESGDSLHLPEPTATASAPAAPPPPPLLPPSPPSVPVAPGTARRSEPSQGLPRSRSGRSRAGERPCSAIRDLARAGDPNAAAVERTLKVFATAWGDSKPLTLETWGLGLAAALAGRISFDRLEALARDADAPSIADPARWFSRSLTLELKRLGVKKPADGATRQCSPSAGRTVSPINLSIL